MVDTEIIESHACTHNILELCENECFDLGRRKISRQVCTYRRCFTAEGETTGPMSSTGKEI